MPHNSFGGFAPVAEYKVSCSKAVEYSFWTDVIPECRV